MSTYGPREPRSNGEVARTMRIVGVVLIVVAAAISFADNWLATWINSGGTGPRTLVLHIWSITVLLGYPLGSFLIVGAIIVNRLPERPQSSAE